MRLTRIVGWLCLGITLAIMVGGVTLTRLAAPEGDQHRIAGFAIGDMGEQAFIPRRALDCTTPTRDRRREVCRLTVEGRELVAEIAHDDHDINFPACHIRYGEREGSCWASGLVHGGSYATASRVGLGLSTAALAETVRRQPFATWREADWLRAGNVATTIGAVCIATAAFLLLPQRLPVRALGAFTVGGLAWGGGWFVTLFALLAAGLVD